MLIHFARKPFFRSLLLVAVIGLLATGCKTYDEQNRVIDYWRQGNLPRAVAEADKMAEKNSGNKDAVIWKLEQGAVLRANGQYDISGLRVGGPYSVTVSGPNVPTTTQDSIYLGLDHPQSVDFTPSTQVVTLAAVSVAESRDTTFDPDKMGTSATYDAVQIAEIPSVRRDVQDIANQDTRIGLTTNTSTGEFSMSAQGQNSRYNSFLIDGQQANDPFGLNARLC